VAGDHRGCTRSDRRQRFNPRPRVAGDPHRGPRRTWSVCFNPRPRVAGDDVPNNIFYLDYVSIHARVWRATYVNATPASYYTVSIHARVWRATVAGPWYTIGSVVSIHARVWRATFTWISLALRRA